MEVARYQFVNQLDALGDHRHEQANYAGEVAAGPVQAGDETKLDRVGADCEDDRNRLSRRLRGRRGGCGTAMMTATWRRTKSSASAGSCSRLSDAHRYSAVEFRPSMKPLSDKPRCTAAMSTLDLSENLGSRYPITGDERCCARAASGHVAAPASPAMNSRRLIGSPRRRWPTAFPGS